MKTFSITYGIANGIIVPDECIKLLGFLTDNNLSFHNHIRFSSLCKLAANHMYTAGSHRNILQKLKLSMDLLFTILITVHQLITSVQRRMNVSLRKCRKEHAFLVSFCMINENQVKWRNKSSKLVKFSTLHFQFSRRWMWLCCIWIGELMTLVLSLTFSSCMPLFTAWRKGWMIYTP